MSEAIVTHALSKSFPGKGKIKTVQAVCNLNLSVKRGEIFGFLGPNGAGKTTCQRMLTTLLPISGGEALVAGFDVCKQPAKVRQNIGCVSQLGGADKEATGYENLMLAGRLYGLSKSEATERITSFAKLLKLEELLPRFVKTYSGGQKRRLEIAQSILHHPKILFMDEPTSGLDPQNRANIWNYIRTLRNDGITVFLTTHYLDEADALVDRLAIMDGGKIVAEGTPFELKRQVTAEEIAERVKRETQTHVTLDDVFLKLTGHNLRDTGSE